MPREILAKRILNKSKKRDSWFLTDYTLNLYSGCSFNCQFCYIRGSRYGQHMERSLSVKANAIELLDKELATRARKGEYGIIALSSATDPYLQAEAELQQTRKALEVILKHRFPLHMLTRSDLIERDFDLLLEIDRKAILPSDLDTRLGRGVIVSFSFSSVDDRVSKIFEPGATLPSTRLQALERTVTSGFLTGVSMMPLLPWISDTTESLHSMLQAFKAAGADFVLPASLTLHGTSTSDSKPLVFRAIEKHYPQLLDKYKGYFENSDYMPAYYTRALHERMKELSLHYQIRLAICHGPK